ncbi:MAG TPA: IS30 family transposase, partial [Thermoleophilia bacterium]|nr:IS30 family transposase [Thermoleophilia bacterium]
VFSVATDVAVSFCDPQSPRQRGSCENTNGLLRQYFPRKTDLSVYTRADLDAVAARLNGRPRKTLAYETPADDVAARVVDRLDPPQPS